MDVGWATRCWSINLGVRLRPHVKCGTYYNMCSLSSQPLSTKDSDGISKSQAKVERRRRGRRHGIGLPKRIALSPSELREQGREILFPETPRALSGLPDMSRPFTVLGIETSCDDTGAAVVRSDGVLLGEALAKQHSIHEQWGGVVPSLARDAHVTNIEAVIDQALRNAGLSSAEEVDAVAVTVGPGLEICLRVGVRKAQALAEQYSKPFVAVHHLEAHVMLARQAWDGGETPVERTPQSAVEYPFLTLLVSGGHCQMLVSEGVGKHAILGGTLDDALGESYDKVTSGGGPAVEALAREGDPASVSLPIPMQHKRNMNFSYAGLKNAFRMQMQERAARHADGLLTRQDKADLCAAFQSVAIKHLEERLGRAMQLCEERGVRTLAVVGGVAANQEVRRRLQDLCQGREEPWKMIVPPIKLCTDNGIMVGWSAVERLQDGISNVTEGLDVFPRLPLGSQVAEEELAAAFAKRD